MRISINLPLIIQMERSGTIAPILKQSFSLRAISTHHKIKDVECDFSPLLCRQTYQLVRTVPTYNPTLDPPFQHPANSQTRSLKAISPSKSQTSILLPKPTTHFCQVCRETFDDYLKHIAHPLHLRKVQEADRSLDFDSLKLSVDSPKRKGRKLTWADQESGSLGLESQECRSETSWDEIKSVGSKKRIILRQDGEIETVSVTSSTNCVDEDDSSPKLPVRKGGRKFSQFRELRT